jgi:hypothetical protein
METCKTMNTTRIAGIMCAAWIILATDAALAAPVYLACSVTGNGATTRLDVAADESTQMATYSFPDGGPSGRVAAIFTPTTLSFPMGNGVVTVTIDRATLQVRREANGVGILDSGMCTLRKKPPKQAF